MDYYILQTFLLVIALLFIIAIVCYHYTKHRSGKKTYWPSNNIKMENDELKKIILKLVRVKKLKILILIISYWMKNHEKIF